MHPSALTARILSDPPGVVEAPARADPHLVIHVGRSANVECERGGLRCRAAGPSHMSFALKSAEFVEHWFFVGLPIALSVRRFGG